MSISKIDIAAKATRLEMGLKKCGRENWVEGDFGCGKIKPVADFSAANRTSDGLQSTCKECRAKTLTEYRKTDSGKASIAKYQKSDARKAYVAKHQKTDAYKAYMAKYQKSPAGKASQAKSKANPAPFETYGHQLSPYMEVRVSPEDLKSLQVKCYYCNQWTTPTVREVRTKLDSINGALPGENNLYCNQACKVSCPTYNQNMYPKGFKKASSRETQPLVRKMAFERDNYTCTNEDCPKDGSVLHGHHVFGVAHDPMVQSDINNIITLCKTCHVALHKRPGCSLNDYKCN